MCQKKLFSLAIHQCIYPKYKFEALWPHQTILPFHLLTKPSTNIMILQKTYSAINFNFGNFGLMCFQNLFGFIAISFAWLVCKYKHSACRNRFFWRAPLQWIWTWIHVAILLLVFNSFFSEDSFCSWRSKQRTRCKYVFMNCSVTLILNNLTNVTKICNVLRQKFVQHTLPAMPMHRKAFQNNRFFKQFSCCVEHAFCARMQQQKKISHHVVIENICTSTMQYYEFHIVLLFFCDFSVQRFFVIFLHLGCPLARKTKAITMGMLHAFSSFIWLCQYMTPLWTTILTLFFSQENFYQNKRPQRQD